MSVRRALVAVLCAWPLAAAAHGGIPRSTQALPRAGGPSLLGTTVGAFVTSDDGQGWQWLCEETLGPGRSTQLLWHRSASGALFAADFGGLWRSTDEGCDFRRDPAFDATGAADLDSAGPVVFAGSARFGATNRVFRSTDDGATFSPTVIASDQEFYGSVRLAPSRPARVYVGAWWFDPTYTMALLRSDDGGDTFERVALTGALGSTGAFAVLAVDPLDPDVLLASLVPSDVPGTAWVLRSADRGSTWTRVLEAAGGVVGAAYAADGARLFVAAASQVHVSTDRGLSFGPLASPTRNACVATLGGAAYVCGTEAFDGFTAARGEAGQGLEPWMTWSRIRGPLQCPAGTSTEVACGPLYPAMIALLPTAPVDGGPPGAGGGGGGGGAGPCGCGQVPGLPSLAILCLLFVRKRRRGC